MGFWFISRGIAKKFFGLGFWDFLAHFSRRVWLAKNSYRTDFQD